MTGCPTHPGAESVGTCARCGRFYCAPERIELDGLKYCADCGVRADVDWLGHHYRKLEGTRSGLAWFLLFAGVGFVVVSLFVTFTPGADGGARLIGLGFLVFGACSLATFSGKPRLRPALLVGSAVSGVLFAVGAQDPTAALGTLPLLGLAAAAWTDVRTRLFFRVPVPRATLRAHFEREGSNPLAVQASRLALLGLFIPGVCFISLVMGVVALTRIDSKAVPPVGNLSAALGAIVFSLFTSAFWALSFLSARW
ncbi:MAG: hypothetical protein Q8L48_24285 [Archangium sp.]|nr:hypothetical protein [Archangium sp.]